MVIAVFGLGFVGLTTALGLAKVGHKVYGIDINEERINLIKNGQIPFLEPGLPEVLKETLNNRFFVEDSIEKIVKESEAIFYCVGTPYGNDGEANLTFLYDAVETTLKYIDDEKFRLLIIKSTVPPSTTKEKIIPFMQKSGIGVGKNIGIANNPEFLREGYCYDDFMNADRIVIGCEEPKSKEVAFKIYENFNVPIHNVSLNTGEYIKYLSNTLLATLISYSNEMALLANCIGDIDISKAFKILHEDKRWNNCKMTSYVYPGCGYGGYCLPKDTNALYAISKNKGFELKLLGDVIKINNDMPNIIAKQIEGKIKRNEKIAILGLSFKPNSDDVRDTSAAKIIKILLEDGYSNIIAYDPVANEEFKKVYDYNIEYKNSLESILKEADIIVITTAWDEFKEINKDKKIVDCRYIL